MCLTDLIKGRKNIVTQKGEGINLAIHLIKEFQDRTFKFKGLKKKYSGISGENLLQCIEEELGNMLLLYCYTAMIKKNTDRKGISQLKIKLVGKASMMSKYNPLDIELKIKTEAIQRCPYSCIDNRTIN